MNTKKTVSVLLSTLLAGFLVASPLVFVVAASDNDIPTRKIVVFAKDISDAEKDNILADFGVQKIKHLKAGKSSVVVAGARVVEKLRKNSAVLRLDDDVIVTTLENLHGETKGSRNTSTPPPEVLPWGISMVKASQVWSTTTADAVIVAVVDTGIDLTHPDLKENIVGGYNAINPAKYSNDDNGHGSHVAGIIAAMDNTIGVVGVAPKVNLLSVKVLGRNGSGYLSDVVEGIDWAVAHGANVINMSLGSSSNIQSLHDAVIRAQNAGVVVVAAAGNNYGGAVSFPGAYSEVIAVSSIASDKVISSFSSVGPEVDLTAPGSSIYSTYKGGAYATLSGTSMATPHVAGVAALLISMTAKCDVDNSGTCSPLEVQNRLESTATDLGVSGKDSKYGSGLVDAFVALQ